MGIRIFLGISALVWLPYGVFLFFQPGYLAEVTGVTASGATALIELRAMYGGLQIAIGALSGLAVLRSDLRRSALVTLAFLCTGLGVTRLGAAALGSELSAYTAMALAFEFVLAGLSIWFLSRTSPAVDASV